MTTHCLNKLFRGLTVALASVWLLGGCATAYPPLPADAQLPSDYTYVIGAGDGVLIYVWGNPEVSQTVSVRPDGKITAPLVEELPAAGKTPQELARDIEGVLGTFIKNPLVTVMVQGFAGPYEEQIRVVGQASQPQAMPYTVGMTLLDLMIQVGGVTDFAAGNKTSIVRMVDGEQHQFGVRIDDLLDGDMTANVEMKPGDIMIIPESIF